MSIPRIIHKIFLNDHDTIPEFPGDMESAIQTWKSMNPGFKLRMYSGADCREYIRKYFDDRVLKAYNKLRPYSYRCDLMRHLILCNEGGWYSDIRQVCLKPLEILYQKNPKYVTSLDAPPNQLCLFTSFIGSVPNHPISKKMIDLILWNVEHDHYGIDCLYTTGPGAYMTAAIDHLREFPRECAVGQHVIQGMSSYIDFGGYNFVHHKYNDAKGADNSDVPGTNDYGDMWRKRMIYN